jgi:hypothetical protein
MGKKLMMIVFPAILLVVAFLVPTAHASTSSANNIAIIHAVFDPIGEGNQAIAIARCESGFNSSAYNPISIYGSHAEGLFQILYWSTWSTTTQRYSNPYDPWANAYAAREIFLRDGRSWREWVCQP